MVIFLRQTPGQTRKSHMQGLQCLRTRTTACKRVISFPYVIAIYEISNTGFVLEAFMLCYFWCYCSVTFYSYVMCCQSENPLWHAIALKLHTWNFVGLKATLYIVTFQDNPDNPHCMLLENECCHCFFAKLLQSRGDCLCVCLSVFLSVVANE